MNFELLVDGYACQAAAANRSIGCEHPSVAISDLPFTILPSHLGLANPHGNAPLPLSPDCCKEFLSIYFTNDLLHSTMGPYIGAGYC